MLFTSTLPIFAPARSQMRRDEETSTNREQNKASARLNSGQMSDEDYPLVLAVQKGDRSAYNLLVDRYQDRLYNALVRYLRHSEDALDVLQDAFCNAYGAIRGFQGGARFYTWIYRIAINLAIDMRRRKKPNVSLSVFKEDMPCQSRGDEAPAPNAGIERQEAGELIHQALARLSDEHRLVIVLKEIEEMKYEDIALVMNIPIGTVRSRLHRARSELKAVLEKMDPSLTESAKED